MFVFLLKLLKLILKKSLYNKHYQSILVTFLRETGPFSGRIGALRWSILVGKQKHNVQRPRKREHFISMLRIIFIARDKLTTGLTLDSRKVFCEFLLLQVYKI